MNRDQILNRKAKPVPETVDGVEMYFIRVPWETAEELDKHRKDTDEFSNIAVLVEWIIAACVDENGTAVFNADDAAAWRKQDIQYIFDVYRAAMKVNTLNVDTAKKN